MADDDVFSDAAIKRLAQTAKLPSNADLPSFGESVRTVATMYRQAANEAASAKIRADVEAIRQTVKPRNERNKIRQPHLIVSALEKASPETLRMLRQRADLRGEVWPTDDDILDPARMDDAARILAALTRIGGSVKQGRKRAADKQSKKYEVQLYAPVSPRNFAKREAERIAVVQLRVAWRWAAARGDVAAERAMPSNIPATSASHERPGPFVKLVRDFFKALRVNLDAVHLINSTDFKRPTATRD